MAGLIFIIPIIAFDLWLFLTTGRRQARRWLELSQPQRLIGAVLIGLALAVWLAFFCRFGYGPKLRVQGLPVPVIFFHLEDNNTWTHTQLPPPMPLIGMAADFLTGLIVPFIPYKISEFIKAVKAEVK